jgi:hypothetical protein
VLLCCSAVYWNSRLQHEHEVLVSEHISPRSVVADVFCGVGPFAIPLALEPRYCTVHANDLNPASHEALVANVALNRVGARVIPYNMDGRAFLRRLVAERVPFTAAVMNLPADALSFLDAFVGLYAPAARSGSTANAGVDPSASTSAAVDTEGSGALTSPLESTTAGLKRRRVDVEDAALAPACAPALPLPRLHVYCFSKAPTLEGAVADVTARAAAALGLLASPSALDHVSVSGAPGPSAEAGVLDATALSLPAPAPTAALLPGLQVRRVRDVAPKKLMLCVSFDLPPSVAYCCTVRGEES